MTADLPLGERTQSFDDYVAQLSATTGMPHSYCRSNAEKLQTVLAEMDKVLAGLTRGLDLSVLDRGHGRDGGRMVSFQRVARVFGAVLPSNSPGVHSLWLPAIPLKTPIALKPGREEPWSPYRLIMALVAAGAPREAFGFYPTDHGGAGELLRAVDRSMLFGAGPTVRPYENDPTVELHGPGFSKVLLGDDTADNWQSYLDVMASSIATNGGRSCINASAVWTPRHGPEIAAALAEQLASIRVLPADDPNSQLAAFNNPQVAERINDAIDAGLAVGDAEDATARFREGPRLVRHDRCAWLLPTIVHCRRRDHALASREFLFPYASVIECPADEMAEAIGPTLAASAITQDEELIHSLMRSRLVDRLNIGPVETWRLSWDQPHEGNLFEHLYRQRALHIEPAA
jgi:acyl-CoA reductase-like NAD-dependent aldehyde dehydrogenase